MPNLLIADDSIQIAAVLGEYARKEGFTVYTAYDGEEAMALFARVPFDMVLLDVMMPKKDGFAVCREMRAVSGLPIILITARGEDYERIMGLDIGADDYIVKPFSPGEVMARVRAILRRAQRPETHLDEGGQRFTFDNLSVDLAHFTTLLAGEPVALTKRETELLWLLGTHRGQVFTRDHLLDSLWGYDYEGDSRTVDSHIKRLRAKLDARPHPNWEIKTIWGVGYKFEAAHA